MPAYQESKGDFPPLTRQDVDAAVKVLPTSGYPYEEWLGVCASIIAAYMESGDSKDAAIDKALAWSKQHANHNESDAAFGKRWTGHYDPSKRTPKQLIKRAAQRGWKRQRPPNAAKRPVKRPKGHSTQHTKQAIHAAPTRESAARSNGQAAKARVKGGQGKDHKAQTLPSAAKEQSELADCEFCRLAGKWLEDGQPWESADALARAIDASTRAASMAAIIGRQHVDAEPIAKRPPVDAEPLGHPLGWQRQYDPDSAGYWDAKGWRPIPLDAASGQAEPLGHPLGWRGIESPRQHTPCDSHSLVSDTGAATHGPARGFWGWFETTSHHAAWRKLYDAELANTLN